MAYTFGTGRKTHAAVSVTNRRVLLRCGLSGHLGEKVFYITRTAVDCEACLRASDRSLVGAPPEDSEKP